MTSSESIEVTASTIDQAISRALEQLGAEQDDVTIEVLSTPRAGVLGLGARQARVRVTRRARQEARSGVMSPPPAPPLRATPPEMRRPEPRRETPRPERREPARTAPSATPPEGRSEAAPDDQRERGRTEEPARTGRDREGGGRERGRRRQSEVVPRAAEPRAREHENDRESFEAGEEAGEDARKNADLQEQAREAAIVLERILELMGEQATIEPADSGDPETLELNIKGDGSGILIGRHGQTLDAIEYMVNRVLARKIKDAAPISIDTESYRARRRQLLQRMALSKGEQAKREHVAVTLDPMPPRDRRIVHLALKDDPMITTRSSGDGFMRAIEIVPVDGRREPGERGGESRGRGRGRDRDRDKAPIGQQGGFKHGQKRIV